MAIQTGAIKYRGSFKSIRNYVNLHDENTYAGEKGGANRDLIMNNPAFARTRENMVEFGGCGVAVKALRLGFLNLLPDQTDKNFTGRLMRIVKEVNRRDIEGVKGKRGIYFSEARPTLATMVFNVLESVTESLKLFFLCSHPVGKVDATLKVTDLVIKPILIPKGATHFRVQNHLSVISDYAYSEMSHRYEASNELNGQSVFKYSEYTPIGTALTAEIKAAFPEGTVVGDDCSIIQCVGVEFYVSTNGAHYLPLKGSSMMVADIY
ncbi:MAG: hypothetical protein HXX14_10115 [Bacteroidetes bacterium]|nr:hypothetical protein [Bacteroidota bacterium]NWJ51077.1 hypothetical protein [Bacteroidota bacterium]NWJ51209.1 hypothetical protein [Bacteroidota bacterium]